MGLRYEAWTVPWDAAGFKRKVAMVPDVEGSGSGSMTFLSMPGNPSVSISLAKFGRLDEIISDTTTSLMRVIDCLPDGTNKVIDDWVVEREPSHHQENKTASLSGWGLLSAFDRALIYAFDYPKQPTDQADHIWGGQNLLSNGDFEKVSVSPKQVELIVTATGGTYTITAAGDTTSAIAFDAQASVVEDRLQADIGALNDIIVVQTSSSPRTFLIEMVDPAFGVNFVVNTGSLTGGGSPPATIVSLDDGGNEVTGWTRASTLAQGVQQQGAYDAWTLSSAQNHTLGGQFSLFIDPGAVGSTSNRLGGAQQVVDVVPGQVYQLSVWVRPTESTIRIRLGLFGIGEEAIVLSDHQGETFTANTWNEITIPNFVMPEGVDRVIFRVACTNTGPSNPGGFYIDDATMFEGLAGTSIGDIWTVLLDDAVVDHAADPRGTVLEWIDYSSFTATLDSGGNPWNEMALSFSARWGSTYGHVLDDTINLGYEVELVPKDTPVGGKTHDFHIYNPMGRDDNPSVGLNTNQPVFGGDSLKRTPKYTASLIVSPDGAWTEAEDAGSLADFGRLEMHHAAPDASNETSRDLLADNLFAFEAANRQAVNFKTVETLTGHRPLVDYKLGDTIAMSQPPGLLKQNRRVQRVDYVNTHPTQYTIVGSRVLKGEAAAYDLIRRMWRRMNRPNALQKSSSIPFTGESSGGVPRLVISAFDASDISKLKADLEDIHPIWVPALSEKGEVRLTEGTFFAPTDLDIADGVYVTGAGQGGTWLSGNATDWTFVGDSGMRFLTFLPPGC